MQAFILAGGEGKRLRPYTTVLPKPLMPVGNYPILEIILRQLKAVGVTEIILAVSRAHQIFRAFFQNGDGIGLKISYSYEESALGTAGPIALALDSLDNDFLVMNGDILTTLNYQSLISFHTSKNAAATIGVSHREVYIDYGVTEIDKSGKLAGYIEKPTYNFDVSMGIYMLNAKAIRPYLTPGEFLDIPDLMIRLKEGGDDVYCYRKPCIWLDIGRQDDFMKASEIFNSEREKFLPTDP